MRSGTPRWGADLARAAIRPQSVDRLVGARKRRTIGPTTAIPLDLARAQATHAIAEYLQSGLPRIGQSKSRAPTLQDFID